MTKEQRLRRAVDRAAARVLEALKQHFATDYGAGTVAEHCAATIEYNKAEIACLRAEIRWMEFTGKAFYD